MYCAHCPPKVEHNSFYLTPLRNPRSTVWYKVTPVGHLTLTNTVKWICSSAGMGGYKSNHSLRATTATRMFQLGVDQLTACCEDVVDFVLQYFMTRNFISLGFGCTSMSM